jgi:hypothetical protein
MGTLLALQGGWISKAGVISFEQPEIAMIG